MIFDNDPPEISIDGVNLFEGNTGFTTAVFTLSLSSPATAQSTVLYQTEDLSANGGVDYATISGQIIFDRGNSAQTIAVPIIGDTIPEGDESFQIILTDPVNLQLGQAQANGLILDDDQPDILVEDITVIEADTETKTGSILVRLSHTTTQTVSVDFESRAGTAIPAEDFSNVEGTLFFAPGELEKEIQIVIEGDTVVEGNEFISMQFRNNRNGNLDRPESMIFIVDNDGAPIISIRDESTEEGDAPHNLVFTLQLSTASALPVSVAYRTADEDARVNEDYFGKSGTISFPPGELTQIVFITISGDSQFEDDEAFFLVLSDPINGILERNQGRATILNDDAPSLFTVENQSLLEGAAGQTPTLNFQVKLLPANSRQAEIDYAIVSESAIESEDYLTSIPNGTLTFPPGTTLQEVGVSLIGDNIIEKDERFFIQLRNPNNAEIKDFQAIGTILNDDGVSVHIGDSSIIEPDQGEVALLFPLTLAQPSSQTVTVNYATADGTAISNLDYQPSNGRITFPPGLLSQNLQVNIKGDLLDEPNESLSIHLSNPVNSVISRNEAFGVIVDNDPPRVSIDNVTVIGNRAGSVLARFTVQLSSPSAETVTISYFTANGTATAGTDFSEQSGSLVFEPGNTELNIPIQVKGNTLDESDEHFFVNLSNPVKATLGLTRGRGTILNEETINIPPAVRILTPKDGDQLEDTSPIIITALASDEDGSVEEVEFEVDGELIATLQSQPWSFVWENGEIGNHTITAIAKDDQGASTASNPVEFVITHLNLPPVINAPVNQTTLEDVALSNIVFSAGDVENPIEKLLIAANSSNSQLINQSGIAIEGIDGNQTLTLTPLKDQFGEVTINIMVSDLEGLTAIESFLLTVLPVNDPPTLGGIADVALSENPGIVSVPLKGISSGPPNENDSVSVSARELNPSPHVRSIFIDYTPPNNTGNLVIEMTDAVSGIVNTELEVVVTDEGGLEASTRFKVSVVNEVPVNIPPVISITVPQGGDQLEDTSPVIISAFANDEDGSVVEVEFEVDGEQIATLASEPWFFVWEGGDLGIHTVTAIAMDDKGASTISHPVEFVIVHLNQAPFINAPVNQTTLEDVAISGISYSVGDAEDPTDQLVLSTNSSNPQLLDQDGIILEGLGENRTFTLTPLKDQFGETSINITLKDLDGLTTNESFLLTVTPVNDPPTLDPITDILLTDNQKVVNVPLKGISSGPPNENDSVSISARELSSESLIASISVDYSPPNTAGNLTIKMNDNASGTAKTEVIAVVRDEGGLEVSSRFNISVVEPSVTLSLPARLDVFCHSEWVDFELNPENIDPEKVAKVEYLASDNVFSGVGPSPTYSFRWEEPSIGDFKVRVRVTLIDGSVIISEGHTIAVTEECGEIAVVRDEDRSESQVTLLRDYLFEMGLALVEFSPETIGLIDENFDGVIVLTSEFHSISDTMSAALSALRTQHEVFGELPMPFYLVGARLFDVFESSDQSDWRELTGMESVSVSFQQGAEVWLRSLAEQQENPSAPPNGRFGPILPSRGENTDEPVILDVGQLPDRATGLTSSEPLTVSDISQEFLVRFPPEGVFDESQRRVISQTFDIWEGQWAEIESELYLDSITKRKRMFQNNLCWLMRCQTCGNADLSLGIDPTRNGSPDGAVKMNAGETHVETLRIINNGACEITAAALEVLVPDGQTLEKVTTTAGRGWDGSFNGQGGAFVDIGRIGRGDPAKVEIELHIKAYFQPESPLIINSRSNNTLPSGKELDFEVEGKLDPPESDSFIEGDLVLSLIEIAGGFKIIVEGQPTQQFILQETNDLSAIWTDVSSFRDTIGPEGRFEVSQPHRAGARFFRAIGK